MGNLDLFYERIPEENRKPSELIPYFAYYCSENKLNITPTVITDCFKELALQPYSNISSYLSSKSKGRTSLFLKEECGYKLTRTTKERIAKNLNEIIHIPTSEDLLPLSILVNTQYYLISIAKQMCKCYDAGLYDASLVMMRKLLETLIIECFERYGIEDEIKKDGHFLYLSDLIPAFINSKKWTASRNLISNMPKIKKYGDSSAHNRRFIAKKIDFNEFKFELRQVVEEIVLTIDYPNWNPDKKTKNTTSSKVLNPL